MAGVETNAQHVSEAEARDKALGFLSPMMRARGEAMPATDLRLAHQAVAGETTCYYVFNNGHDRGFVIVAGDQVADDILGYSEDGSFDPALMPDNMRLWLEGYQRQIACAAAHGINRQNPVHRATMRRIEPLMADIKWSQNRPHNLLLDESENKVPVGCVTTAATQVMYYYRWPNRDSGLRLEPMQVTLKDGRQYWLPRIDRDYTYDWGSFRGYYDRNAEYSSSQQELASAANLGYRMSRAIESEYETDGTGAAFPNAGGVMISNFDYSKQMRYCKRMYYSDNDWEQLVYGELAEGRPVLYDGKDVNSDSGHAFICDGYDGAGRFSINWGWGGYCNGFFLLTPVNGQVALAPEGSGTGGAGNEAEYSKSQTALVKVMPNGGEGWPVYMEGRIIQLDKSSVAVGDEVSLEGEFYNNTFETVNPVVGFYLQDKMDVTRKFFVGRYSSGLKSRYYLRRVSGLVIPGEVTANRTYRVQPAYKDDNGEWQVMASPDKVSKLELTVTSGTGLVAKSDPEVENNGMIVGSDFAVKVNVYNPTNSAIAHNVRVYIYRVNDTESSPCAYWKVTQRSFDSRRTVEETLQSGALTILRDMPLGDDYYLRMYDQSEGKWISNNVGFTLLDPAGIKEVQADDSGAAALSRVYRVDGQPATDDARGLVISHGRVIFRR